MKEKYPKVREYWVYVFKTPNNMYYVGYSGQIVFKRWSNTPNNYKSLQPYIKEFGWDNIEKIVVKDGLTKEQALIWENRLICMYLDLNCCINKKKSGGDKYRKYRMKLYSQQPEIKEKQKQYDHYKNQQPEQKQKNREYKRKQLQQPEYKIYNRVKSYNICHPDKNIITPSEAKEMYLLTGYIPTFIKNCDL